MSTPEEKDPWKNEVDLDKASQVYAAWRDPEYREAYGNAKMSFLEGVKWAQQWISVKDRLPEEGQTVIAYFTTRFDLEEYEPSMQMVILEKDTANELIWKEHSEGWPDWELKDCSHWMPLPEPPKEDNEGLCAKCTDAKKRAEQAGSNQFNLCKQCIRILYPDK